LYDDVRHHLNQQQRFPQKVFTQGVRIMNPQELKSILSHGLLSFPVTDFNAQGDFHQAGYIKRLEWLAPYGATALFAAGGTGEFFSLAASEYSQVVKTAVDTCATSVPILAGVGGSTSYRVRSRSRASGCQRPAAAAALPD
jgi:5-dehydro-4-deoxyglucarate dehydratase